MIKVRESRISGETVALASRLAKSAMSRLVTLGVRSASPPAMTRMAVKSSEGGVSFNMKPLAPDRKAA
jgi:hypothetical protein